MTNIKKLAADLSSVPLIGAVLPHSDLMDQLAALVGIGGTGLVSAVTAEAEILTNFSNFAIRDAANGRAVVAQASGIAVAQDTLFNSHKYFSMPGTANARLREKIAMINAHTLVAVCKTPHTTAESKSLISQPASTAWRVRGGNGAWLPQTGTGGAGVSTINTTAMTQSVDQVGIYWETLDPVANVFSCGWNTYNSLSSAALTNDVPQTSPYIDFGGHPPEGADDNPWPSPVAGWFIIGQCLKGTSPLDTLRTSVLDACASYYGVTLT